MAMPSEDTPCTSPCATLTITLLAVAGALAAGESTALCAWPKAATPDNITATVTACIAKRAVDMSPPIVWPGAWDDKPSYAPGSPSLQGIGAPSARAQARRNLPGVSPAIHDNPTPITVG